MKASTSRFSNRVDDYVKYRPHYPQQIIELLADKIELTTSDIVADIGSGTGISTELFLNNKNNVYAVEPNKEMRLAAEKSFRGNINFTSIDGTAEKTNLPDKDIDIIFSGTAFHWFNREVARTEFERILKPGGHVVLAWNVRKKEDPFQKEYKKILDQIPEFGNSTHTNIKDPEISQFFYPKIMHKEIVQNSQIFNLIGLQGRLLSSSYCPKEEFYLKN